MRTSSGRRSPGAKHRAGDGLGERRLQIFVFDQGAGGIGQGLIVPPPLGGPQSRLGNRERIARLPSGSVASTWIDGVDVGFSAIHESDRTGRWDRHSDSDRNSASPDKEPTDPAAAPAASRDRRRRSARSPPHEQVDEQKQADPAPDFGRRRRLASYRIVTRGRRLHVESGGGGGRRVKQKISQITQSYTRASCECHRQQPIRRKCRRNWPRRRCAETGAGEGKKKPDPTREIRLRSITFVSGGAQGRLPLEKLVSLQSWLESISTGVVGWRQLLTKGHAEDRRAEQLASRWSASSFRAAGVAERPGQEHGAAGAVPAQLGAGVSQAGAAQAGASQAGAAHAGASQAGAAPPQPQQR